MSPRRRVRRDFTKPRSVREYLESAVAVLAVAGGTVLAVWLIRPGGAASNQPRIAAVLFGGCLLFLMSYAVSGTPDRPVVGRGTLWGGVLFLAACVASGGAVLQEVVGWKHAFEISAWIAGGIVVFAGLCEVMLVIRHWSGGQRSLRILLSLALALVTGGVAAVVWPGGVKISHGTRVPTTPSIPTNVVPPSSAEPIPSSTP